ncbi:protein kinase domain-containing protein [Nostoc sp.]
MIALPGIAIQDKIYESSNSLVYRGIRDDGVAIIVKMLKLDYPSSQELTRYRQEYKITRSLNLEGVVKAYSQQDYQRTLVILLEDFSGESLEKWMHKRPDIFCPMPLSTFLGLAIAICNILGRIHAANVIHKDINPGNIVLNLDTGVVKIIDFGIATQFNRTNPTFKNPHVLEGTLAYLSPEQTGRMNRLLDYRTDFYSLGVTLYELLTGHLPFATTDILELVHCHIAKHSIPPDEINTTIPKPVSDIILKLMAKNAEDRYQSAWGIKADLEICAEQLKEIGKISSIQLALQDVYDRFQIPQRLYGRDEEVAMLLAAFDRVACPESNPVAALPNDSETTSQREQAGNPKFQVEMMLVSGYAGIGKSALVQEIYKPITQKRGYFISGKFDQFGRNIPYSAIADALQKLVQQLLGESDEQVQQWRSQLLTALGTNGFLDLLAAIQVGLIQPLSELDEDLLIQEYKFLHDRVQQAAYILIDESQKQIVHLQIGRNLLEKTLPERISDRLFEIVDHLNHGIELVADQSERNEIARLNLIAGQKAKTAIAYSMAQKYLATARVWLAASSWQTNYDLTLDLYLETTEVEYLCGDFEQVEYWVAIVLQEAKTILDIVRVYEVKIQTDMAQGQLLKAIDTGLQVLQQLGIMFPDTPNSSDIHLELDIISSCLQETSIADLIHLPEMSEPNRLAAMRILSRIMGAAYIAAPNLMPLLVSKRINLSIQYGNSFVSPFAYANFGLILCGLVGNIESGYQFGQLALGMLSRLNSHSLKARTLNIVNNFIIHWKEHNGELLKPLLEAYQGGLETGDFEFAAYSAYNYCFQSFVIGKELVNVECEMRTYSEAIRQIKHETALNWIQIFQQTVSNLMERSINPTRLVGEFYNEESRLPRHQVANDGTTIFIVYFNKLFLYYLFSKYAQAVESSALAESHLSYVTALPLIPLYYFYDSLARLATYLESSAEVWAEILKKVALSQEKMKQWAHYAPMNHLHKYYLVEAEKARVLGQLLEAEELYEQAIQGARDNEYLQEEALAYELAAKFYLSRGRGKFAQTYMKEAHYCYDRWGATAKVKDLETRYPQFFPQPSGMAHTPIHKTSVTPSNHSPIAFDLAAVMKASLAISSEIELDKLLSSLMKILIENAGAQTGSLILENLGKWVIEASSELNEGENVYATQVLQSIPTANHLPESIINYVIRTHESVILNDATREGNFINEPYIQQNQTKSLLCLPLLNQNKLVGVLYLENQLATGAFTPERVSFGDATRTQVLHLLSTHAAIAIENAKLYAKLRSSESKMAQFLEAVPVGIGIMDAVGSPYYFNQKAIQLLGKGIDPSITLDQISEVYQIYLAGTDQKYPTEKLPVMRALNGECTRIDDSEIRRNNVTIPVEAWGTPVFDEQGNVAYAITAVQDITERRQAERLLADYNRTLEQQVAQRTAALQESEAALGEREQELRLITDALPALISYVDANGRYRFINQTYEVWFLCSRDEILGKSVRELLGETAYRITEPYINQVQAGQITTYETEILYPFGKKYISTTFIPDFSPNAQVKGYYGLVIDISDRKRAEQASILEERNRMAREIHDTLAQAFTGIVLHNGTAIELITKKPETALAHMETVDELARTGLTEARRSVAALRPKLLEERDLPNVLKYLAAQMKPSTNTNLTCEIIGAAYALSSDIENNLLRIGQEAITNAVRYARATEIQVELVYQEMQCCLRVRDNGQGFDTNQITMNQGFGLLGMSERSEYIGGELIVKSQPGQGTEIVVIVNRELAA